MNKFNAFIERRNFKKIFIVYVIATIICGAACAGTVGYAFRDKINLALQYEKTSKALSKQNSDEIKKQSIDSLAVRRMIFVTFWFSMTKTMLCIPQRNQILRRTARLN